LLLQVPIGYLSLNLLGPDLQVREFAIQYFQIRIWSAPATLGGFALIGWFIGMQNARVPLIIVLVANTTNIILDLWFVLGLGMKVEGVAAASVIAEYLGFATGLIFAAAELRKYSGRWLLVTLTRVAEYRAFLTVNGQLFVRTISLVFVFSFVTAQGARQGGLILAANAVLMNFQNLVAFALDGLAHAAEALVGKAVGARNKEALTRSVSLTLRWSLGFAVLFSLAFWIGGPALIRLMTSLPDVQATAYTYLPWLVVSPVISVWSFLYDGVFVGATRAREMRNNMVFSTLFIFLPAWFAFRYLGNNGLWLAFTLFMASRGIGMHYFYRRGLLR
jgi:MATE family multidrug resistance protein